MTVQQADSKQTYFGDDTEANRKATEMTVGWQTCANM